MSEPLPEGSRFAVLASGSGTNLQALLDEYPGHLVVVAGDKEEAFAFERARRAGVAVEFVDPGDFASRKEFDRGLAERVAAHDVGLVVGAGYMRVLTPVFLELFPAVINVHPSLLPEFRGLGAIGRALEAGREKTGVTVHYMVEEVDAGPVIRQEAVPILSGDTEEELHNRLRPVEHRLLVGAVADYFWGEGKDMKRRALVSVSNKKGVAAFARRLREMGFEIISTGGTAKALMEAGVPVVPVSEVTGAPEMLGGRVKTLHPRLHGGILADLEDPEQVVELVDHGIGPVDLVCVNLYPFEETVAGGASEKEAIEQIDIGGPAMLRAAAKNFRSVTVVPAPEFYEEVAAELEFGEVPLETRRRLALEAFRKTAGYDAAIARWLTESFDGEEPEGASDQLPEVLERRYERAFVLRYGENPHQEAAYYAEAGASRLLSGVEQVQGRPISFNNLYDVDAVRTVLADISVSGVPAAVIVKHANPCGAAAGGDLAAAYGKAFDSDPTSAFGGIVALNGPVDGELARRISEVFTEVLIAPGFDAEAREVFSEKPNMILLEAGPLERPKLSAKHVTGGLLLQHADRVEDDSGYETATAREPSPEELSDLLFAWRVAKGVKSNAIVLVKGGATVGIGAGQTSRVEAAELAVKKAGERAEGAVAASDAFFPFADGLETLAEADVRAVIQPGGSKRDGEVTRAADERGVAMVMTGRRHFLH